MLILKGVYMAVLKRAYLSIEDIARDYLPMSKKKIREFVANNLNCTKIGGRIYVSRKELETWLCSNHQ